MKKELLIGMGAGVLMGVVAVAGFFVLNVFDTNALDVLGSGKNYFSTGKVNVLGQAIDTYYIDETENDALLEGIYKGYVSGLGDAGTKYLTADDFRKIQEEEEGNYIGPGVRFAWGLTNQYMIITEVIKGSEAEEAGIKVGDKIITVDGIPMMMSNEIEVYKKLLYTGEVPITYTVVDNDGSNQRDIVLTAEVVNFENVESELVVDKIGYIDIESLVDGTTDEVKTHMDQLIENGASQVILDLRSTSSRVVDEVVALCDLFLDETNLFTVKNYEHQEINYKAENGKYNEDLVILVNDTTEGPIEAFVAIMKEEGRAIIVGRETSGEATLQENVPLEDGSGLVITTGYIVMPDGSMIREDGVTPDIVQRTSPEATIELLTTGTLPLINDDVIKKAIEVLSE